MAEEDNRTAGRLSDRFVEANGFVRYTIELAGQGRLG
jgi:hypothetical protein